MQTHARRSFVLTVTTAALLLAGTAHAAIHSYRATINGTQEVPANASPHTGSAVISIDDVANTLSYNISYTGVSGTETAAHIHGMAARGVNVGVLHTLPTTSLSKVGTWTYLEAQEADILAGRTYINIHSSPSFGGGEIRGQIDETLPDLPGTGPLSIVALGIVLLFGAGVFLTRRRSALA